jgi:NAD(P)-dependent dehydrogenase (short-subunit alcohol dehydrogenase family)
MSAARFAGQTISVTGASAGYTHTVMTKATAPPALYNYLQTACERVPLGRLLTPDEVAGTFAFLASAVAAGITGANFVVDGGLTANGYILETLPAA